MGLGGIRVPKSFTQIITLSSLGKCSGVPDCLMLCTELHHLVNLPEESNDGRLELVIELHGRKLRLYTPLLNGTGRRADEARRGDDKSSA